MKRYLPRCTVLGLATDLIAAMACSDSAIGPHDSISRLAQHTTEAIAYSVTDLGAFGTGRVQAFAIDKHGTVLGRYTRADAASRSFRWTERGGYEDLGDFEGRAFLVLGTNDNGLLNGSIAVGPGNPRAVAWLPHEGFIYLDGDNAGSTLGSNDHGAIAGTRFGTGSSAAFVWTARDGVQLIPLLVEGRSVLSSNGADLNKYGTVVGTLISQPEGGGPRTNRAFIWDDAHGTTLIPPLGPGSVGVTFISDENVVLGAAETRTPLPGERRASPLASSPGDVPVHAWKWSDATGLVDLGTLGGRHSVAWHADRHGNVYGWSSDAANVRHAVKWSVEGPVVDLGTLGGDTFIGGLNKHGVLVGWSVMAAGETHAVRFVPIK